MRKVLMAIGALMIVATLLVNVTIVPRMQGQATPSVPLDPCFSNTPKSSVSVSVATATTTQLVALVAGQKVFVCGGYLEIASSATTAATVQFEYGTGASCGTGTTVLTGTLGTGTATAGIDAEPILLPAPITNFTTASGNALCVVTAGTTVSLQGYVTYVQQ